MNMPSKCALLLALTWSHLTLAQECQLTATQNNVVYGKVDRRQRVEYTGSDITLSGIVLPERRITLTVDCTSPHYVRLFINGISLPYKGRQFFSFGQQGVMKVSAASALADNRAAGLLLINKGESRRKGNGDAQQKITPGAGIAFMQNTHEKAMTHLTVQLLVNPFIIGNDLNPAETEMLSSDLRVSLDAQPE